MSRVKADDAACSLVNRVATDLTSETTSAVLQKNSTLSGRCIMRELNPNMWCSKSDGDLPGSASGSTEGNAKKTRSTSKLTPEILVTYARDLEERKEYEERYRAAVLGAFGTSKSYTHLSVPTVLKTDKEAVVREYNSDPCIAALGLLG